MADSLIAGIVASNGDTQNKHIFGVNLVDNHVLSHRKPTAAEAKVLASGTPDIRKARK
jgi:hypothetical protein